MNTNEHVNTLSVKGARYLLKHFALVLLGALVLSGCGGGGGGGGGGSGSPDSGANVLSGTAAAGAPLANATVTLKDSAGVVETTTADAKGNYSFDVSGKQFPVMLEVQPNIPGAVPLFSASLASGIANITPLTDLQVFEAAGGADPSTIYNSGDFSQIGNSTLDYGKTAVDSNLVSQLTSNGLATNLDPITTPMVANGDGIDALLDQIKIAINGSNASLTDSTGKCIPYGPPNVMTFAIDGMDVGDLAAFLGAPPVALGGVMDDQYVKKALYNANVPGIDQPRPLLVPGVTNPSVMPSNVIWTRNPSYYDTYASPSSAVKQLESQLENAYLTNELAKQEGGPEGPINIVAHSWGGVIAYIALTELANQGSPIQVANLITMGTPVECVADDCPDNVLDAATLQSVPPFVKGPIVKPTNVTTWTNYWGNDDIISAKIRPQPGVTNKYVDCEGYLYGDLSVDPQTLPCTISNPLDLLASVPLWLADQNHSQYFKSPTGGTPPTIIDIDWLVTSSRTNASSAQSTSSPISTIVSLPPTTFSTSADSPFCSTSNPSGPAVLLNWSTAEGAASYRVFRNGSAIGVDLNASQLNYTDRGIVAGQTYSFNVEAINAGGTTWSNTVSVTVPATVCGTVNPGQGSPGTNTNTTPLSFTALTPVSLSTSVAPYQPTLTASGANFSNLTLIRFDWSGPTTGTKTWYRSDLNWNAKVALSPDGSSMTLAPMVVAAGDPAGHTTWTVTLMDSAGATATKTFTVNYAPATTAPPPTTLAVPTNQSPGSPISPGLTLGSSTVTVIWDASSGATFYVGGITDIATGSDVVTIDTSGTSTTATLSPGKQYRWYVYACNSSGCSSSSTLYYFQTPTAASAPTCTTSFNTSSESIDATGGQRQVILTTSDPSCTWSASSTQAWVNNITPSSGTAGATLTYTVDPNSSTQSRLATIMAGQATLTVSQLGTSASCTFSLGEATQSVPADGGTFSDGLLASSQNCPRTAQSNAAFITNVSPTSGNGDANISYTVAPNNSVSARSGTLTIAGQTLTVDQVGSASATPTTPTTPTILSPGSTSNPGPTLGSSTVTVSWNAPNGAQLYVGGITDIAAGSDVVTINTSGTSTTATLSPGKQYRWYVYACNSSGCSNSSAFYYFQTPTAPSTTMTPPTLTAPADYATGQSLTPTLQWSGGSATYWQVNIRDVSTGVMVLTSAALSPSQTSYAVPSGVLQSGVQYRWNVAACPDAACLSGYQVGSPYYFTTN
ncbi:MAG: BACON domain-containing protein [Acidobacteriaceae bacterium]